MTNVIVQYDPRSLPPADDSTIPVQIYGNSYIRRKGTSCIGNKAYKDVGKLGLFIPPAEMDFLTIALAVTAADTFVNRKNADNNWTREIKLCIALAEPERWAPVKEKLERCLGFLSGDIWSLHFLTGGAKSPQSVKHASKFFINVSGLDSVSLFSGGLDSAIGAINMLHSGRKPLLISHSYKGDNKAQQKIKECLTGTFSHFATQAYPRVGIAGKTTDVSMRTRSISFIAFAVIGAYAVKTVNQLRSVDINMPENGFISLNAPLTIRRTGSLSTRTTHPHFIKSLQEILSQVGLNYNIINPYQFMTKGEMVKGCANQDLLKKVVDFTVSCSHWKRPKRQCGRCVPCLIRRASLHAGDIKERILYIAHSSSELKIMLKDEKLKDDIFALASAMIRAKSGDTKSWILRAGCIDPNVLEEANNIFLRGLNEVEEYFKSQGLPC